MVTLFLAALVAFEAASVQAPSTTVPIQPSVDSARQRQALGELTVCLAERRPRWAREMLALPYLSDAQSRVAARVTMGSDSTCIGAEDEVTMRTSGIVAGLTQHFLRADIQREDFRRVATALNTLTPLNVSEDFALCIAARDPAAARDLALSDYGSAGEARAARQLAGHIESCTNPGEQLTVDQQALRALVSTALYRGVSAVLRPRG
ncbi:MAG: hypothetical protein ACK4SZ_11125 [Allosphingosinicella sp.]|uniref:hypothetical protein n=1 Tax=Allosphingosinicella sp. TaxID=2823234 RepID=UPI003932A2C2